MENNQPNSNKSNRGGARPGAGRPKKSNEPLSPQDQVKILQEKLKNCGPRHAAAIARRIAILTGVEKPYCKTAEQRQERDRRLARLNDPPEPNPVLARAHRVLGRVALVERVADRLRNAEQILTSEEIDTGLRLDFSPEELLESVRRWNTEWYPEGTPKTNEQWDEFYRLHPDREKALWDRVRQPVIG